MFASLIIDNVLCFLTLAAFAFCLTLFFYFFPSSVAINFILQFELTNSGQKTV